ncbi:MAG: SUMF1/EgtB/PvdO family nonheme iron enzyme [Acidobacteria bacterium]|jgi:8-oxo-dGTP pyrophosphatase MutT (NUDIX family)|nr:SUMF1/EgtB/PvdO family nonheme iron enzyme [Acidobacteriota bacterium]
MEHPLVKYLKDEELKLNDNIAALKDDEQKNEVIVFLNKVKKAGLRVSNDNGGREWLSLVARKWARFLSEKTGKYFSVNIFPYNESSVTSPYKYLESYDEKDTEIFFGRNDEILKFLHIIDNSRVSLLFGKSGAGKTSFLRAGILPKLKVLNYLPIYIRCGINPIEEIIKKIKLERGGFITNSADELPKILIEVTEFLKEKDRQKLVIILDQFEEFFITINEAAQKSSVKILKNVIESDLINVKFIFSFREDFLANFYEIGEEIHEIFNNRYRLKELSLSNAKESILNPLELFGLRMEDGLVDKILSDFLSNDYINPPQLQIVCHSLYQLKMNEEGFIITESDYIKLGGVKDILAQYLDDALNDFSGKRKKFAKEILKAMITSKNTRVSLNNLEIESLARKEEVSALDIKNIIEILINRRIIIRLFTGIDSYELTHEYLIEKIKEWMNESSYDLKKAQDMLKQEENNWLNYKIIMECDKFEIINKKRTELNIDDYKSGLLLRTAVEHNIDIEYWIEKNIDNANALELLESAIKDRNPEIKRNAVSAILQIDKNPMNRKDILNLLDEVGNPSILNIIVKINQKFNKLDESSIKIIRNIIEHSVIKNMTVVPGGTCLIGFPPEIIAELKEKGLYTAWFDKEYPLHTIYVEDLLIDKYLVTNEEYKEFEPNHTFPIDQEKHPATNVSFEKAKAYANWLGKEIPTEEEWEKAARGTDGRLFPWGNRWIPNNCNTKLSGISGTTPVDEYPEGISPYGCYDMAGNVWEWTSTSREEYDGKNQTKRKVQIVRGGSWSQQGILPWCAYKYDYNPNEGMQNVGFRCIRRIKNLEKDSTLEYSAGGLIFKNESGRLIVLLGNENVNGTAAWRIPKGTIDENESVVECVKREVKEETGFSAKIVDFIGCANWSYERDQKVWDETALFFVLELAQEDQEKRDNTFVELKWFDINEAIGILEFVSEREIARKAEDVYKENLKDNKGYLYDES